MYLPSSRIPSSRMFHGVATSLLGTFKQRIGEPASAAVSDSAVPNRQEEAPGQLGVVPKKGSNGDKLNGTPRKALEPIEAEVWTSHGSCLETS
jgi:hypothetical protein